MKTTIQNSLALLAAAVCRGMINRRKLHARGSLLPCRVLPFALAVLGFQVTSAAVNYQVLHHFGGTLPPDNAPDGYHLYAAGVIEGQDDGKLYGTAYDGGANNVGIVFRINRDGTDYEVITNLPAGLSGGRPYSALVQGRDGAFYGQTVSGSAYGHGAIFRLQFAPEAGWSCSVLYSFTGGTSAYGPKGALIEDSQADGVFYGTSPLGGVKGRGAVFSLTNSVANGVTFTLLGSFSNPDGDTPSAALVEGSDGYLYGTTQGGGNKYNQGVVFRTAKIRDPAALFSVLHDFPSFIYDGAQLYAALMKGSDGRLYGTTAYGGTNGAGLVFRVNEGTPPSGYEVLRNFEWDMTLDGSHPWGAALVERRDGALLGVTSDGGVLGLTGYGTIFKLNKNGSGYEVLYRFAGAPGDGRYPNGTLVRGRDGAYYGTTTYGGANDVGTIFRIGAPGDLDGDLDVDSQDALVFAAAYRASEGEENYNLDCDYNRSGRVSAYDYRIWFRYYLQHREP